MNETLQHAIQYAERGWRVIPIKPGEKRPPITSWQTVATTNPDTIETWWSGPYRNHGIGIVTGEESGIFVIDIDDKNGVDGYATLHDLEQQHGQLPDGPRAQTGTGGMHIFLANPTGMIIRNDAGKKLGHGIDIRGDNGQVVAAPTIHPNGNTYHWHDDTFQLPVPDAPTWLIELLTEPATTEPAPATSQTDTTTDDTYSAAASYNRRTNWFDLLTTDGWTYGGQDHNGVHHWTRPGKDPRDGISATVGHEGRDALTVFTTSIEWLPPGTYSRFGYYANRHHNGDRSAAAKYIRELDYQPAEQFLAELPTIEPNTTPTENIEPIINRTELAHLVDWNQFWTGDHADEDWLAYPLIPRGRAISLFAPAKAGKSSVVLAVAAAVASGKPVLGLKPVEPVDVLYLDYEMTQSDLFERLTDLGYGPDDNLERLHYALLPSMPPLDTIEGARAVLALVEATNAELVIVDTFGRAVEGDEDSADTVRAFYRHTGLTLKSRGTTYLRTDHSGKDVNKGQRGSSAKNDDVDLVWKLQRTDTTTGTGVTLTRTHSRISWVPETIKIIRKETDTQTEYQIENAIPTYPDGTAFDMETLKQCGITPKDSQRAAAEKIKTAGITMKQKSLRNALDMMKKNAQIIDPLAHIKTDKKSDAADDAAKTTRPTRQPDAAHQNDDANDAPNGNMATHHDAKSDAIRHGDRRGVRPIKRTHPTHPTNAPIHTDPLDLFGA